MTPMEPVEYIGVSDANSHVGGTDWLKRHLLMYDRIALLSLESTISQLRVYKGDATKIDTAANYEYLKSIGVVYEPRYQLSDDNEDIKALVQDAQDASDAFTEEFGANPNRWRTRAASAQEPTDNAFRLNYDMHIHLARAAALQLTEQGQRACALYQPSVWGSSASGRRKIAVRTLIIDEFPQVDEGYSFQDILMIRDEPEFRDRQARLRVWSNKAAEGTAPVLDIQEELRYMRNEFERYLRAAKIKHRSSALGAVVKTGDGLYRHDVMGLFEGICSIREVHADMKVSEFHAPGIDASFLTYVSDQLSSR